MPGKRLIGVDRDMVVKLIEYFNQEKRNGGPLLPVHAVHERISQAIPDEMLNAVATHMVVKLVDFFNQEKYNGGPILPVHAVHERVSQALGISLRTVSRVCKEAQMSEKEDVPTTSVAKYGPRKKHKTEDLMETKKIEVRDAIYNMYSEKKHVTLKTLKEELATKGILDISVMSLHRLLPHIPHIGLKYKKEDNRWTLMEKTDIFAQTNCQLMRETDEASLKMAQQNTREQVLELMRQKDKIESEIRELTDILTQNGVGMKDPLVDAEGFPLNSVDVYQVRNARHRIICLQNDHKNIMKSIENGLQGYYSSTSAAIPSVTPMDTSERPAMVVHKVPFAKVTLVTPGSPADYAGIHVNDEVVEFGSINAGNFKNITDIAGVVQHSEGAQVNVKLKRGERYVTLGLIPKKWAGRGLLGCNIVGL